MQFSMVFTFFILYLMIDSAVGNLPSNESEEDAAYIVKVNERSRTAITIKSPKFDKPYPRLTDVLWDIETSGRVGIFCHVFKLRPRRKGRCSDYVSIKDGGNITRYCGTELNGMTYESSSNQISLKFKSGRKSNSKYIGFNCTISQHRSTFSCSQDATPVVNSRIIGGEGSFPWQASLFSVESQQLTCGGSIIHQRWILTAAHCIFDLKTGVELQPNQLEVIVGRQCLSQQSEGIVANPIKFYHPGFNKDNGYNDIALIQLKDDLNFAGTTIRPIAIANIDDTFAGAAAIISGHGNTAQDANPADCLQNAIVPTITNEVCQQAYAPIQYQIIPQQICAGYPEGKIGPCNGDSGSALVIVPNGVNKYVQIGVFSIIRQPDGKCAQPQSPSIYTRTSSYYHWITQTTGVGNLACS